MPPQKTVVHGFQMCVDAKIPPVEPDLREVAAQRGRAGRSENPISKGLMNQRRILLVIRERHAVRPGELLAGNEFVEIDVQTRTVIICGTEESALAKAYLGHLESIDHDRSLEAGIRLVGVGLRFCQPFLAKLP